VKSVGVTSAIENATRLFVNDLYFALNDDVLGILFEHRIRLQQLVNAVNTLRLCLVVANNFLLLTETLGIIKTGFIFQFIEFHSYLGKDKERCVFAFTRD